MRRGRGILVACLWGVVWLATSLPASGQPANEVMDYPVMAIGDIEFYTDTGGIRGPEGFTRQEMFLLLDAAQLDYRKDGGEYVAEAEMRVVLTDSTGQVVEDRKWHRSVSVMDPESLGTNRVPFTDVMGFDLKSGIYQYMLSVRDTRSDLNGTCTGSMAVRGFEGERLAISDVLVATRVSEAAETGGRFEKHGWHVSPNVTRTFAANGSIGFYVEIYHLSPAPEPAEPVDSTERAEPDEKTGGDPPDGPASAETFVLGYSLMDTLGQVVRKYPPTMLIKPGSSVVKVDSIDVEGIEPGAYGLRVEVLDRGSRQVARVERTIFLSVPPRPPELTEAQKDQLRYYADIRYLGDDKDLSQYKKLKNRRARMRFLRRFWKTLDPSPGTPENERLEEHIGRMRHAENNFAAGRGKRGSDTDKGRVFIKYGQASDIQYNLASQREKPFEVWTYETSGGYRFIFQDRRGAGIFDLVHSTHPRELSNPNWRGLQ